MVCCPNCDSTAVDWMPGEANCIECGWTGSPYDLIEWPDDENNEDNPNEETNK